MRPNFRNSCRSLWKRLSTPAIDRARPLLVVIGAQKSGTTALFQYLRLHPQLVAPTVKELNFFNTRHIGSSKSRKYSRCFPSIQSDFRKAEVVGSFDISPAYMLDAEQVINRIYKYAPDMKIVALLRDPICRAYSAWNMYRGYYKEDRRWFLRQDWVRSGVQSKKRLVRRSGRFGENFETDISEELKVLLDGDRIEMPIVEFGLYKRQLKFVYDIFPRENILVLDSAEFRTDIVHQLRKLEKLIGVERYQWTDDVLVPHFVGQYDDSISSTARECLREIYGEENRDLCFLVRRRFSWLSDVGWTTNH